MTQVRPYTRTDPRTGRTVRVGPSTRGDGGALPEQDQARRDRFERRVQRDRHATERRELLERQGTPARQRPVRAPGEKTRNKRQRGPSPKGAARRARKAVRMMRNHKVRAVLMLGIAGAELGAWGVRKAGSGAWKTGAKGVRAVRRRPGRKSRGKR